MSDELPDPAPAGTPLARDADAMSSAYEVLRLSQLRESVAMWVRMRPRILMPLFFIYAAVHAVAGVGPRRLAALAAIWAVLFASHARSGRRARHHVVSEGSAFRGALFHLAMHAGILALTGGIRSALLPMIVGPAVGGVITHGRGPKADAVVGFTLAIVAGLAVLPASLTGDRIPAPYDVLVGALSLVTSVLILRYTILLVGDSNRRVAESLGRMRCDVLDAATARARSLESVSARVAHELKNPLAAVKGLVQLMARGAPDERARERLEVAGQEVSRMEEILRTYLSFARPAEALRTGPVELMVLADDVVAVLEARASEAGVWIRAGGVGATVTGDARRLKEALLNLVANAIEATPRDGSVEVLVRPTRGGGEVTVRDTGRGMAPDVLARVGTPYFTTRPEGTGLGVALARVAVEQHGGTLAYQSAAGAGTVALVSLPSVRAARDAAPGEGRA